MTEPRSENKGQNEANLAGCELAVRVPVQLTARHRAVRKIERGRLPKVQRFHNQISVVLRVNDRGPAHPGRIIDVSEAAADRPGFTEGLTAVTVEIVSGPTWRAELPG